MQYESRTYGWHYWPDALRLLLAPKQFFEGLSCRPSPAWRHFLSASLAAAVLQYVTGNAWDNWFGAFVFFLNAVGMTCIYSGAVFLFARGVFRLPCSLGQVFAICVYASLGPLLLSWIPGAVWVSEPWKWWTTAIGLSACIPEGLGKCGVLIALALGAVYILFRILLFTV